MAVKGHVSLKDTGYQAFQIVHVRELLLLFLAYFSTITQSVPGCQDLLTIGNGSVNYSIVVYHVNGRRPFNTTATYTCIPGYKLIGETTRTCQSDKIWSGQEPTCDSKWFISIVLFKTLLL